MLKRKWRENNNNSNNNINNHYDNTNTEIKQQHDIMKY